MADNTISSKTYRDVYRTKSLTKLLRKALVAEKICNVDRRGLKTISSPYGSQATAVIQEITGRYNISAYQTTDDTLTVNKEIIVAEHVYDFEETLTAFDIFAFRVDEQNFAVAYAVDKYVLNYMVKNAGDTYVSPALGFSDVANLPIIVSQLVSKFAGYSQTYNGLYIVLENTDLPGIIQKMMTSGFNFADTALRNGFLNNYAGVDLYVVRVGTFSTYSAGSESFQNQGKRLAGVKKQVTYAEPQGIKHEEKGVSQKTGKEVVTYAYTGVKVWTPNAVLTVAITLTSNPSPSPSASPSASVSPSASASSSPSPSA